MLIVNFKLVFLLLVPFFNINANHTASETNSESESPRPWGKDLRFPQQIEPALKNAGKNVTKKNGIVGGIVQEETTTDPNYKAHLTMDCGVWPKSWHSSYHFYSSEMFQNDPHVYVYSESGVIYSHSGRKRGPGSLYPWRTRCMIRFISLEGKKWQFFSQDTLQIGRGDALFSAERNPYTGTLKYNKVSVDAKVSSSGPELNLYFFTNEVAEETGFTLYFSQYRDPNPDCNDEEFECHNRRCIHEELKCDGFPACSDYSDENTEECDGNDGIIIIGVCVAVVAILIVTVVIAVYVIKKKKRGNQTTVVVMSHPPPPPPTVVMHGGPQHNLLPYLPPNHIPPPAIYLDPGSY